MVVIKFAVVIGFYSYWKIDRFDIIENIYQSGKQND